MQPTFIPWAGYFNLIHQSDCFVFLDDVQFQKPSWQNRNRVVVSGKPHWLTVPTNREGLSDHLKDITLDDRHNWRKKHCALISQNYSKHPFYNDINKVLEVIEDKNIKNLSELNIKIIKSLCAQLEIEINPFLSSEIGIIDGRSKRLIEMMKHLNCNTYLSPQGSREYLEEDDEFDKGSLVYQDYSPADYEQINTDNFISHMSIIDVLANLGTKETRNYIIS